MIIGSVLERGNWKYIVLFVPLWIVFVYAPICFSLWGHGNWLGKWSTGLFRRTSSPYYRWNRKSCFSNNITNTFKEFIDI